VLWKAPPLPGLLRCQQTTAPRPKAKPSGRPKA